MDHLAIEKKLREAEFFLGHMRAQESKAFGDREPYTMPGGSELKATTAGAKWIEFLRRLVTQFKTDHP
jgi:hypothetical protein